ncbi:MAG TPA: GDP-mannose 4,6-dehydratase [bacterium]|nr:GDP-mannose 4,6-dehydratase [bacterium]
MKALITGITGQDGAYLARFLLGKGYEVFGLYRRTSTPNFWRLLNLGIFDKIRLIPGDMTDIASLSNAVIECEPDEIYNLAAQSFVGTSFEEPLATAQVDGLGVASLLTSIKQINPRIRLYHASTSELYGISESKAKVLLNEQSSFWPASPYAAAKLYAFHQVRIYREAYGIFAVNGILFNHESPLRGLEFVTRKISNGVARIKVGLAETLELGNLDAERDWGYAPEYVEAMWLMLQQDKPDDFVIATGESHSVKEFVEQTCAHLGLDWQEVVVVRERFKRPLDVPCLRGDASRAGQKLGWSPKIHFRELAELMVEEDLKRWNSYLEGQLFPWDAINDQLLYQGHSALLQPPSE